MNRTISLFFSLMKNWLRSKSGVFFSILFPLMLLLVFSTVFGGQSTAEYTLYVQNNDVVDGEASNLSEAFVSNLSSVESLNIKKLDRDVNVTGYRKDREAFGSYRVLVIPDGFQEKALNKSMSIRMGVMQDTLLRINDQAAGDMNESQRQNLADGIETVGEWRNRTAESESAEVLLLTSEGDQAGPIVEGITYSVVNSFNSRIIGAADSSIRIDPGSLQTEELKPVDYYLPGFIAAFIMANGIIGVTSNISDYKRNGTLKRLAATPLKKIEWILGNILQQGVLALALTAVMVLVAVVLFGVTAYPNLPSLALVFLGSIAFSTVGMVMGGAIKDVEAASGAGNAVAFPMMFLSGAFWPIEQMPDYLQTIAKFLPLYYFHQGLRSFMILDDLSQAWIPFAVIGSFALVFAVLAVLATKWKEL